jgi:hypothetical protein
MNNDQGLHCDNDSIPSSQNKFSKAGLKPDIIELFGCVDNVGNPEVERKFQNKICGALNGLFHSLRPAAAYWVSIESIRDL